MAYNCRRGIPWNSGLELCAAQVEDCSFFFIEENINIDPRVARERDSTTIIFIIEGNATGKHIEQEFMI